MTIVPACCVTTRCSMPSPSPNNRWLSLRIVEVSRRHAMLVREWGPVTLFLNGVVEPDTAALQQFEARGVAVERRPVAAIASGAEGLTVQLADGDAVLARTLFTPREVVFDSICRVSAPGPGVSRPVIACVNSPIL